MSIIIPILIVWSVLGAFVCFICAAESGDINIAIKEAKLKKQLLISFILGPLVFSGHI